MANYGYETRENTAFIKGGMPVQVKGTYEWDETGASVTDVTVGWANTGKPVTPRFLESLTAADWDAITNAIAEGE